MSRRRVEGGPISPDPTTESSSSSSNSGSPRPILPLFPQRVTISSGSSSSGDGPPSHASRYEDWLMEREQNWEQEQERLEAMQEEESDEDEGVAAVAIPPPQVNRPRFDPENEDYDCMRCRRIIHGTDLEVHREMHIEEDRRAAAARRRAAAAAARRPGPASRTGRRRVSPASTVQLMTQRLRPRDELKKKMAKAEEERLARAMEVYKKGARTVKKKKIGG